MKDFSVSFYVLWVLYLPYYQYCHFSHCDVIGKVVINRCSGCTRKCPSNIELPSTGSLETSGECFQCQKCIDICPKGNVHCGIKELKGNEVFFTIFKALLLMSLLFWAGV